MKSVRKTFVVCLLLMAIFAGLGLISPAVLAEESEDVEIFRIGLADIPKSMDPIQNVGNANLRVHANVFETLINPNPLNDYELEPMLAESYEKIDDKTIEFKLRPEVKFHDGSTLTSEDVQYSFDRLKNEEIANTSLASSLLSTIDHVEIIDELTFQVVAKDTDPILDQRLASTMGAWIVPKAYIEEVGDDVFAEKPIGTGPYKVESYSPEKIVLSRFEEYWGEKPIAKTVEYVLYPETATRVTALMTGEVDMIAQLPADQVSLLENEEGIEVTGLPIINMHLVVFNTTNPALADKRTRQALAMSIDRELLCETLWKGKAEVPQGHQYHEYGQAYIEDYEGYKYDPEAAKALLEESDYNGEEVIFEVVPNYYTFYNEAAEAMVDMWNEIGFNATVKFVDKKSQESISAWSNTMRFPDHLGGLWLLWGESSGRKDKTWGDMPETFIETGKAMETAVDLEERIALAKELMSIWDDEVPATPLYYPYEYWAYSANYKWTPYSNQIIDLRPHNLEIAK